MKNQSIIKWRFLWAYIWVIGIIYILFYIGEDQFFGTHYSAFAFGMFLLVYAVYYYLKTRLFPFVILGFVMATAYWHYELAAHMDTPFSMLTFYLHLVTFFVIILILSPGINKAIKLELHARKLFRLASEPVRGTENGFTSRPYSAGRMDYRMEDVIGLGRFMAGKEILLYHQRPDGIIFSFSMNISPLVDKELSRTSTVSFDNQGNISVKISRKDYNQYRKKLSFDQLCDSFAQLFGHFIKAYQNNNETRIINELKSA